MEKPRGYHGERKKKNPRAKTLRATGPKGFFDHGTRGTPFIMIAPRLFHKMAFFWHPKLVYGIFSADGAPREYCGQYVYHGGNTIESLKSNILARDV